MCKANDRMETVLSDLLDVKNMIEELQQEETALIDEIKAYMGDDETMVIGTHKIRYAEVVSKRVDTTALKKILGDALEDYYKTIVTRPFKVN